MNTTPPTESALPDLPDERVEEMEKRVFARIGAERKTQVARRTVRRRWWAGGAAAAAVVVLAAVIAPYISVGTTATSSAGSSAADAPAVVPGRGLPGSTEEGWVSLDGSTVPGAQTGSGAADGAREIATTASANVVVDDVAGAARAIGDDAEARGGYVETTSIDSAVPTRETSGGASDTMVAPYPYPVDGGWISVRVPSDQLTDAVEALDARGEVTSSSIARQDVTDQAIDLRARVAASEASVARLTELIGQAQSVADLIAAESALADRQATLNSDRQQLESLENQVSLSTLTVQLTPVTPTVTADPAGFGDGIVAGWNGLVATLNGIVVAIGFLLPWIAVVGVIAIVAWGVTRLVRGARARKGAAARRPSE
ncbi:uncharacterized protein DUF4349 [Microbacterium sp. AG1240]|uniref:DUF4349 domain-containing protein n=1 Tax=Microbacterium sp. AG1240 TaxID=2183992 RepID=UPI000EAF16BE|nr:DUF4349 domain-containing protein [Microbacterium sp. AG1240]RKT36676.1 uncharacterized protein DUF4349 [Microbacterium sp. AG1240]